MGIDARVRPGQSGGLEQFLVGLAYGLSSLDDGAERYLFLCRPGESDWLRPYVGGSCEIVESLGTKGWHEGLPVSDGTLEALGSHVIHFPRQDAFVTERPSIYQPWDLQHLHLPSLFEPDAIATREHRYRAYCSRASQVVVASAWGKADLVTQYGIEPDRISVIGVPAPTAAYRDLPADVEEAIARSLALPDRFVVYPAQTWQHKNHLRLLEALAWLRDKRGLLIELVCTGRTNEHFSVIEDAMGRFALGDRVRFLGFIGTEEIQVVYRSALALVFPSLFEGWGLPVVEAMSVGLPVACSRVTSLPDMVGDAAILFDPADVRDIASALERLWTDDVLRRDLVERGHRRVRDLNWPDTARAYRALYRATAGWV